MKVLQSAKKRGEVLSLVRCEVAAIPKPDTPRQPPTKRQRFDDFDDDDDFCTSDETDEVEIYHRAPSGTCDGIYIVDQNAIE